MYFRYVGADYPRHVGALAGASADSVQLFTPLTLVLALLYFDTVSWFLGLKNFSTLSTMFSL